jgi:hypothetical protein
MSATICEYCDKDNGEPVRVYDAGNGTTANFHTDCHAEMMGGEICGGEESCDVGLDTDGDHCPCFADGLACCGCKAVPLMSALRTFRGLLTLVGIDDRGATARAREHAAQFNGALSESRRTVAELQRDLRTAQSDAEEASGHVVTLSAEVDRLRKIEADALADDDVATYEREAAHNVKAERDELQRRCDALTKRAQALASDLLQMEAAKDRAVADSSDRWQRTRAALAAETARADAAEQWRAAHQVALDGLAGREPAEVAPAAEVCAWCLGSAELEYSTTVQDGGTELLRLCHRDWYDTRTSTTAAIRARVATRAASCPARRHSPDPLAIACDGDAGCGAMRGEPCSTDPFFPKATD